LTQILIESLARLVLALTVQFSRSVPRFSRGALIRYHHA